MIVIPHTTANISHLEIRYPERGRKHTITVLMAKHLSMNLEIRYPERGRKLNRAKINKTVLIIWK